MAHAHDNTLLSRLSFADPDKKEPFHDLGCQYIVQPHIVAALGLKTRLDMLVSKGEGKYKTTIGFIDAAFSVAFAYEGEKKVQSPFVREFTCYRDAVNYIKEHGIYGDEPEEARPYIDERRFTFAQEQLAIGRDRPGVFSAAYLAPYERVVRHGVGPEIWKTSEYVVVAATQWKGKEDICVEVKIKPVGLGEILRQIGLYREYVSANRWILAAAFEMSADFVETLRSENIVAVHLGDNFRKWAAERQVAPSSNSAPSI